MGYERYRRGGGSQGEYQGRRDLEDYDFGRGPGRDYGYSDVPDYQAGGYRGGGDRDPDEQPYGQRDYGNAGYQRWLQQGGSGRRYGQERYNAGRDGRTDDRGGYSSYRQGTDENRYGRSAYQDHGRSQSRGGGDYGWQPQDYDYEDRGFMARAGDEVRSWFGDEDAERRREADTRHDERSYHERDRSDRDEDYHGWRRRQIDSLDRDYDEYRSENRSRFENEFSAWRSTRQSQRDALGKVDEHMEVVGSDGSHVGTVDKIRGDRILLTKRDPDAEGHHHSIPSRWIETVDDKVKLSKTADEARKHWRDEERNASDYGDETARDRDSQGRMLNRSFSGTY